jgi:hypothetical protein
LPLPAESVYGHECIGKHAQLIAVVLVLFRQATLQKLDRVRSILGTLNVVMLGSPATKSILFSLNLAKIAKGTFGQVVRRHYFKPRLHSINAD